MFNNKLKIVLNSEKLLKMQTKIVQSENQKSISDENMCKMVCLVLTYR